jgi:hypothetical protein
LSSAPRHPRERRLGGERTLVWKSKPGDRRRPTPDELRRLREDFRAAARHSTIPMTHIIDFAVVTAKRESEITRLLQSDAEHRNRTALLRDAKRPRKGWATTSASRSWAKRRTSCGASRSH